MMCLGVVYHVCSKYPDKLAINLRMNSAVEFAYGNSTGIQCTFAWCGIQLVVSCVDGAPMCPSNCLKILI